MIGRRPNPALADLVAEPDTTKLRSGAAGMFMREKRQLKHVPYLNVKFA
jgi:hypothetical protein